MTDNAHAIATAWQIAKPPGRRKMPDYRQWKPLENALHADWVMYGLTSRGVDIVAHLHHACVEIELGYGANTWLSVCVADERAGNIPGRHWGKLALCLAAARIVDQCPRHVFADLREIPSAAIQLGSC